MVYKTGTWGEQAKARHNRRYRNTIRSHGQLGYESVGYQGEKEAEELMVDAKRYKDRIIDYEWKGKLIDVKTSKLYPSKKGGGYWLFVLRKQKGRADMFMVICKGKDWKTEYVFLIPDKDISKENLYIPRKNISDYKKYVFAKQES